MSRFPAGRLLVTACLLFLAGCAAGGAKKPVARPLRTTIDATPVVLPAQLFGSYLVVETKWDRFGPYRFIIDTGSSVTLLAPALVHRYGGSSPGATSRRVMGPDGQVIELPEGSIRRLELGGARFDDVPVLLYDCAALSAHLGVRIDGVLGFPLFRELLLTLDYPGSRVVLRRAKDAPTPPGITIPFDDGRNTPLVPVRLGDRTFVALIDSGSDMAFSLNPVGLAPEFVFGPTVGGTVGTIAGDRTQRIGRLSESLALGSQLFARPIVDLSDELSAIGAGALRHFAVTFDQARDRVTFFRASNEPIEMPARRSAGVSFSKTPAYWRVAGVVPKSAAEAAGIRHGDLVVRINGEPVARWDLKRYDQLVASAPAIAFTFLQGSTETEKRVAVFELVP